MGTDILIYLGATPAVILIFVMGIGFAMFMIVRDRAKDRQISKLFDELKETNYRYNALNMVAKELNTDYRRRTGDSLIKESMNSQADYGINWDTTMPDRRVS